MSSPFADFANAVLRFQVANGDLEADSNGNLRPGVAVVEVSAILEQVRRPEREPRPGVDSEGAFYLEGFAIAPMALPSVVTPKSRCAAQWAGRNGEFFVEPIAPSPWKYEGVTGDELRGWFVQSSLIVSGDPWVPPEPPTSGDSENRLILAIASPGQTTFTLSEILTQPDLASLYLNGLKATYNVHYRIDGVILTWLSPVTLEPGNILEMIVGGDPWVPPEVGGSGDSENRLILAIASPGQTTFTLSEILTQPDLASLYLNGLKATYNVHYRIDGVILTWLSPVTLEPGNILEILWS